MALVLADRVRETTTTTGTGTVTLAGAYTGFQTFSAGVGNTNSTYYTIANVSTGEYEVGIGTYTTSGNTLSRTTVLASSNGGSLVNFAAGSKDVFVTQPAERALYIASAGTGLESKVTAFTNGGIVYASSTSALSTGSALVFDGTNLGIGNTSPASYNSAADNLVIGTSGNNGMTIVSGSTSSGYIMFADGTTGQQAYEGQITYDHTNNFMAFNTSGTERMRIASDTGGVGAVGIGYTSLTSVGNNGLAVLGNVGIGTSSPAFKLDVASTQGVFRLQSTTGTNPVYLLTTNGGGDFYFGRENSTGSTFGSNTGYASVLYSAGAYPIVFLPNGTERMRLDSSGNLGLGVTSVLGRAQFNVSDTSTTILNSTVLYLSNTGAATTNQRIDLAFRWQDGTLNGNSAISAIRESGTARLTALAFAPANSSGDPVEKMRLDSSGNLGIGTSSPAFKLDVGGGDATNIALRSTGTSQARLRGYVNGAESGVIGFLNGGGQVFEVAGTETMRIDSSGNLLVGTTSSQGSSKLVVAGGLRVNNNTDDAISVAAYGGVFGKTVTVSPSTTTTIKNATGSEAAMQLVSGVNSANSIRFFDIVVTMGTGMTPVVVSSGGINSPPARSYTNSSENLQINFGGAFTFVVYVTGIGSNEAA